MPSISFTTVISGTLETEFSEADFSDLRRVEERVMQEALNSSAMLGKKFITASRRTSLLGERGRRCDLLVA